MNSLYKKAEIKVPKGYTNPTRSFKKHVFLAIGGLVLFIATYLVLMIWFARLSYRLFALAFSGNGNFFMTFITAIGLAFLSIFMFKSLFIFKKKEKHDGKELTPETEPVLFDYLYKLADEIGAPRPHKVYLSSM